MRLLAGVPDPGATRDAALAQPGGRFPSRPRCVRMRLPHPLTHVVALDDRRRRIALALAPPPKALYEDLSELTEWHLADKKQARLDAKTRGAAHGAPGRLGQGEEEVEEEEEEDEGDMLARERGGLRPRQTLSVGDWCRSALSSFPHSLLFSSSRLGRKQTRGGKAAWTPPKVFLSRSLAPSPAPHPAGEEPSARG